MNISVFGAKGLAARLGKKGTMTDLALFSVKNEAGIFTFIEPAAYPDKPQVLAFAANLSEFAVINVTPEFMNWQLGETILVLNFLKMEKGAIVLGGVVEEQIKPLLKGTVLEKYKIISNDLAEIWNVLKANVPKLIEGPAKVLIDQFFDVKSVGMVFLGIVTQGTVRQYDELAVFPAKKKIAVRSIQMQDEDVKEAGCYGRVGLAVKGISVDEMGRGYVASKADLPVLKEIPILFEKNKFSKEGLPPQVMACAGLQYAAGKLDGNTLKLDKEIACEKAARILILDPGRKTRILGVAVVQ